MLTIQGRIEAHSIEVNSKTQEETQGVSLYIMTNNFKKIKPAIIELRIPLSIQGLEMHIGKEAVFPITVYSKTASNEVRVMFSEDGRFIQIKNEKGEFHSLAKRPESLKPGTAKTG